MFQLDLPGLLLAPNSSVKKKISAGWINKAGCCIIFAIITPALGPHPPGGGGYSAGNKEVGWGQPLNPPTAVEFVHLNHHFPLCLPGSVLRYTGKFTLWHLSLMIEAVRTSETSVNSNKTIWRCIPEASHLQLSPLSFGVITATSMKMTIFWNVMQHPSTLSSSYSSPW
jgi:hypothetical protein